MIAGVTTAGVTIVTGAASGIGAAVVARLPAGGRRILCDRTPPPGAGDAWVVGDVRDDGFVRQLIAAIGDDRVATLAHCAGVSPSMAAARTVLDVNLGGTLRLLDAVEPRMAPGGAVVLLASTAGHYAGTRADALLAAVTAADAVSTLLPHAPTASTAYALSKRAVQLLARDRAAAFGARGARIVSVSPGLIDTPMGRAERASEPNVAAIIAGGALPRPGGADEVAAAIAFLASPAASFVTGCDLLVDGGQIAAHFKAGAVPLTARAAPA